MATAVSYFLSLATDIESSAACPRDKVYLQLWVPPIRILLGLLVLKRFHISNNTNVEKINICMELDADFYRVTLHAKMGPKAGPSE